MKKTIGIIITLVGLVGTIIFGLQAIQDSETFSFLGIDIGVSTANWTPVIISVILLIVGVIVMGRK
ncbi:MAG TPA: hypothetical protein VKZ54_12775 [Membranihabitans sp.]|nr:hypothetical protein [Membranihabitans sp.]